MFDSMRFTAASDKSPLAGAVLRALEQTGEMSVRSMRACGFKALADMTREGSLRTLAPLPDNAQKLIDDAVVEVGLQRLTFVEDIISEGLVFPLPDPLSVTQIEWSKANKVGAAQRTMSPSARGENKIPIVLPDRLPVYLTTDGFELDVRTLRMSQRIGMPLDTALIKSCVRSVNEAIEDAAINGATTLDGQALAVAGYAAPGLLNAPNANTGSLTLAAWTTAPVGSTVMAEILVGINALQADLKFGPYNMYVPTAVGVALQTDFKANGDKSIIGRISEINAGGRPLRVRTADMLPATKVAIVQMTSDVIDMVDGQRPTVIPYVSLDGFTIHNLVMAIEIPRVRSDYNGNSGVYIGTLA